MFNANINVLSVAKKILINLLLLLLNNVKTSSKVDTWSLTLFTIFIFVHWLQYIFAQLHYHLNKNELKNNNFKKTPKNNNN